MAAVTVITVYGRGPCWYCAQGLHDFCGNIDPNECRCMHGQILTADCVIVAETFWRNPMPTD